MSKLNEWGPMTVLMILLVAIVAGVGGAVVILQPETLGFEEYLEQIKTLALAVAGLGVGRGILAAGKHNAEAKIEATALASSAQPADAPPPNVFGSVKDAGTSNLDFDELDDEDALIEDLEDEDLPEPGVPVAPAGEREP